MALSGRKQNKKIFNVLTKTIFNSLVFRLLRLCFIKQDGQRHGQRGKQRTCSIKKCFRLCCFFTIRWFIRLTCNFHWNWIAGRRASKQKQSPKNALNLFTLLHSWIVWYLETSHLSFNLFLYWNWTTTVCPTKSETMAETKSSKCMYFGDLNPTNEADLTGHI